MSDPNQKPWYKKGWIIVLAVIFVFYIIGTLSMKSDNTANKNSNIPASTTNNTNTSQPQTPVVFDLEALNGKNIDEVRAILGNPKDGTQPEPNQAQLDLGTTQWDNAFDKDGYELGVTFNVQTRNVIDFFLATNDPSGATKDVQGLKEALNVVNTSNYTVEPVKAIIDPTVYTGVKATPKR